VAWLEPCPLQRSALPCAFVADLNAGKLDLVQIAARLAICCAASMSASIGFHCAGRLVHQRTAGDTSNAKRLRIAMQHERCPQPQERSRPRSPLRRGGTWRAPASAGNDMANRSLLGCLASSLRRRSWVRQQRAGFFAEARQVGSLASRACIFRPLAFAGPTGWHASIHFPLIGWNLRHPRRAHGPTGATRACAGAPPQVHRCVAHEDPVH